MYYTGLNMAVSHRLRPGWTISARIGILEGKRAARTSRAPDTVMTTPPQRRSPCPPDIPREWWDEFEAAARRPLRERFKYAFIKTYKPVMDDAPFRSFDTTADYRRWCEENLPDWLGYGRV